MLISAVKIGTSAATSVPKANSSTSDAKTTPAISLAPVLICLSAGVELSEGTTSMPARTVGAAAATSRSDVWASLVVSCPVSRTVIIPIRRLDDMPPIRYGVSTCATCGVRRRASMARSTACLRGLSISVPSAV